VVTKRSNTVGMILDEEMRELMINRKTGKCFKRELCREEKLHVYLARSCDNEESAEETVTMLQKLGYDLEEILEEALNFKY
jgi:hypothetical protein